MHTGAMQNWHESCIALDSTFVRTLTHSPPSFRWQGIGDQTAAAQKKGLTPATGQCTALASQPPALVRTAHKITWEPLLRSCAATRTGVNRHLYVLLYLLWFFYFPFDIFFLTEKKNIVNFLSN